ncbi:MAG: exodeoxyribonuclease V subunit gamma, partial [Parachlamydia sp.]|nr:exodeoxyribonuclease V subunit gamma [Parachlamydia sp.]
MALSLFYSNRVEDLYAQLKRQLFASPCNPFARRLVVVPNPPLKTWLMLQLAKDPDIGIAAGIEVSYPDEMIDRFSESPLFPSRVEIALAIEAQLRRVVRNARDETWAPLMHYLKAPDLTRKGERRLIALSDKLAELFADYQKYGRRMVEDWGSGWQQELWQLLFSQLPAISFKKVKGDVQLHLFAISHLSPLHLDRFVAISERIPTHYYLLSPCQAFWTDIRTDRESRRLHAFWKSRGAAEAQLETLDHYLRDCNPLLANFGRLGREMVRQLEEREIVSDENYALPVSALEHPAYENLIGDVFAAESDRLTLLEAVQADLLLMRKPQEKVALDGEEDSIQVHTAPTRLRETEVIYDLIQNLIAKHDHLRAEDVLVMAPDIMAYAPLVKMVFQREGGLDCHIMEAVAPCDHPSIQGFLNFLKLATSRWSVREVLELFDIPAFRKKHQFRDEDVQTIQDWARKSGVRWGQTHHHRDEVLEGQHCRSGMVEKSDAGTWEKGMERLLKSLIMTPSGEEIAIESSQAELLGRFLELLRSMRSDLNLLRQNTRPLCEWMIYLQTLFEVYFDEDSELLSKQLTDLIKAGQKLQEERFPFATLYHQLESCLNKRRNSYRETHLNAVRFCPLLPMRTVPSKVVILMGLEEGAFPRATSAYSLNLLNSHPQADYCPSKTDFDRYLFLEAILSARQYLILTYQSFQDGKEQAPSLVVQELMAYLDSAYLVGGEVPSIRVTFRHPFHGFDKSNFQSNSRFPCRSLFQFHLAQSYYLKEKSAPFLFIPRFEMSLPVSQTNQQILLDIGDLSRFAKNPLKVYLNKALGLYLPKEDELQGCESFAWSPIDRSIMRKLALKVDFHEVMQPVADRLPLGIFKEVAVREAVDDREEIRYNLRKFGVQETFCLELTKRVDRPLQISDSHWLSPPLEMRTGTGENVTLVGRLEHISEQGMIAWHKKQFEKAVQIYPEFLIYEALALRGGLPLKDRQLIFGRDGKALPSFLEKPEQRLSQYLDYYLLSLSKPSPLMPKWIDSLIKGDQFEKKVAA